jgi:hypothetical protein
MGYDVNEMLEALEVKGLEQWGIPDFTIPEPTNEQLRRFNRSMEALGNKTSEELAELYAASAKAATAELHKRCKTEKRKPTTEEIDEAIDKSAEVVDTPYYRVISDLCSEMVTPEQLAALPGRVFRNWYAWLIRQVKDPLASISASRPSLEVLKGGLNAS